MTERKIVLENGREFYGYAFGAIKETICEIVFNTSMVGYQEVLSDPSYTGQMVVMTYPIIGSYGINDEDNECKTPTMGGMIVRDYNDTPSNFRYTKTLSEAMEEYGIPGIAGVGTREITRIIRDEGSQKVMLTAPETTPEQAKAAMAAWQFPQDVVAQVSCKKRWYSRTPNHRFEVVAVDCGVKMGSIRELNRLGCNVTVVPYNITADQVRALHPDGVFLSNGPGDPENVTTVIQLIQQLQGEIPMFGICLGHQMMCLAAGARTYKMKFGHRGGNQPVRNLDTGLVEITSQNHSFALDMDSVAGTDLRVTHVNLLDGTAEGAENTRYPMFSVQYHPEANPGPEDSHYLFTRFLKMMEERKTTHA